MDRSKLCFTLQNRQKWICLLLAVLTWSVILCVPGFRIPAQAAVKPLTVPDPSTYFGRPWDIDIEEKYTTYSFRSDAGRSTGSISGYFSELEDTWLTTESEPDDASIIFQYQGEKAVIIRSDQRTGEIRLMIRNSLKMENSTPKISYNPVIIPSPVDYFGKISPGEKGYQTCVYTCEHFPTYPEREINSFAEALEPLGFSLCADRSETGGDRVVSFTYNNLDALWIRWQANDQSLVITTLDFLNFEDSGPAPAESSWLLVERHFGDLPRISRDSGHTIMQYSFQDIGRLEYVVYGFLAVMKHQGATCYRHSFVPEAAYYTFSVYLEDTGEWIGGAWSASDPTVRILIRDDLPVKSEMNSE